jgi:cytochrome P450
MLWLGVIALALALAFVVYGFRPLIRWRLRHIPGPPPAWLLGNLAEIAALGPHEAFHRWGKRYGGVYKVLQGGIPTVVIQDPELARWGRCRCGVREARRARASLAPTPACCLLRRWVNGRLPNRHPIPFMETGEEERFNAAGILFARGAYHRSVRAAWQPMFHSGSLEGFVGLVASAADRMGETVGEAADAGRALDVWTLFEALAMQVSARAAFGVELEGGGGAGEGDDDLVAAAKAFIDAAGDLQNVYALLQLLAPPLSPAVRRLASWLTTPAYRRGLAGRRAVRAAVATLLQHHRAAAAAGKLPAASSPSAAAPAPAPARSGVAPGSFLDLMARAVNKDTGHPFSDMEVVCQAFNFVVAAQTTAPALAFALYLLAAHPDKEAKLVAEVDALGPRAPLTPADLARLPYADAVFKETVRLYPTVPLTIREADRDLQLGALAVPAGTHLAVSLYGLHRAAAHWCDPEAFVPERFLGGAPAGGGGEAYMPFGDGVRSCVGHRYAWQMVVVALARLYQGFTFRLAPGQVPLAVRMSLSLAPRDGVVVTASRR